MDMKPKKAKLGILFADVTNSTSLFETLGDDSARAMIADRLNLLNSVIKNNNGKLVKTMGDGIMCIFPTADTTANAAVEMQEIIEREATEWVEMRQTILSVSIGFHFGLTLLEHGDIFGDNVNIAARMVSQAKGGQIITTKSTVEILSDKWKASTRFIDHATIKGKKEEIDIYELIWQEEDVTRMATNRKDIKQQPPKQTRNIEMKVRYHNKYLTVNKERSIVVIGRGKHCDIQVNAKLASRQHIRIELRRDRFFIIDNSTNGSYVHDGQSSENNFLRREEMPVTENHLITLGSASKDDADNNIELLFE